MNNAENANPVKEKSSLGPRLLTAAIGIPLVLFVVWWGGRPFSLFVLCLALMGLRELHEAHERAKIPLFMPIAFPAVIALLSLSEYFASAGSDNKNALVGMLFAMWLLPVLLLIAGVLFYGKRKKFTLTSLAHTQLATYYCGLFSFLILLRNFPEASGHDRGLYLFLLVLLGVWSGDSFAYFAGRAFGKRPLAVLSPKKTVEGTVVGVILAIAVVTVLSTYLGFSWKHGIILGIIIAIATPLGDLAESFWKRELEVKDLGSLLPGHGGILDRCDSLLFACFATYLYAIIAL